MKRIAVHLAASIRFITVLPAGASDSYHPRAMVPFFPAVGLILGLILAAADAIALRFLALPAVAAVDVIVLVALTGALHLDGLADTADGLFSHRGREAALSIMKDSRIGVMGAAALVCILLAKYGGFSSLPSYEEGWARFLILVLVPGFARSSMLFGISFLPYARPEGGTGSDLFAEGLKLREFWGIAVCVILCLLLGWRGLVLILGFTGSCAGLIAFYRARINGITGDMLGAMTELTETVLLLLAAARL
ncbi:MAG: adenosylcobinamide-GDP ribazoletransferase [Thermodesulfobacteriota bacterium]